MTILALETNMRKQIETSIPTPTQFFREYLLGVYTGLSDPMLE